MENVYFYVSIAAFVLAAVLAVAAVVVFVKMDVINAIRFLQGKRVPTSGESSRRRTTRGSRGAGAKKSNPARSVLGGPEGDDRVTDIAHEGPEGDDNMTTVVAPISDEPASARHAKAHAAKVETNVRDENDDEHEVEGESPWHVRSESTSAPRTRWSRSRRAATGRAIRRRTCSGRRAGACSRRTCRTRS